MDIMKGSHVLYAFWRLNPLLKLYITVLLISERGHGIYQGPFTFVLRFVAMTAYPSGNLVTCSQSVHILCIHNSQIVNILLKFP